MSAGVEKVLFHIAHHMFCRNASSEQEKNKSMFLTYSCPANAIALSNPPIFQFARTKICAGQRIFEGSL